MVYPIDFIENQPITQQPFYPSQQGIPVIPESTMIIQNVHPPSQMIQNQQSISMEQSHHSTFVQPSYLMETNAPTSIHPLIPDSTLQVENGDYLESKRLKLASVRILLSDR